MVERLKIITLEAYQDIFRPMITVDHSQMALFNPLDDEYILQNDMMYYQGSVLDMKQVIERMKDPMINKPLLEPILPYGIFSYWYDHGDLRNSPKLETTVGKLSSYLGVTTGVKGFKLVEKLLDLQHMYGIIFGSGIYPLLEVELQQGGRLTLVSPYMHEALNLILAESMKGQTEPKLYYTVKVHASIVAERNKLAALIVIELTRLIVKAGKNVRKPPSIRLRTLASRIPSLHNIWSNPNGTSFQNRQLNRAFRSVVDMMERKTELFNQLKELEVDIPQMKISKLDTVIVIRHNHYHKNYGGGTYGE